MEAMDQDTKAARRPVLRLRDTPLERVLEVLAAAAVAAAILAPALAWPHVPPRVPSHYGLSGTPDAYGPKSALLVAPGLALAVFAGLGILRRYPQLFNYAAPITAENAERQYRLARGLLQWLRAGITGTGAYLSWAGVRVALGRAQGVSEGWVPFFVLVTFAGITGYLIASVRRG